MQAMQTNLVLGFTFDRILLLARRMPTVLVSQNFYRQTGWGGRIARPVRNEAVLVMQRFVHRYAGTESPARWIDLAQRNRSGAWRETGADRSPRSLWQGSRAEGVMLSSL